MSNATAGVSFSQVLVDALSPHVSQEAFAGQGRTCTDSQTADRLSRLRAILGLAEPVEG